MARRLVRGRSHTEYLDVVHIYPTFGFNYSAWMIMNYNKDGFIVALFRMQYDIIHFTSLLNGTLPLIVSSASKMFLGS